MANSKSISRSQSISVIVVLVIICLACIGMFVLATVQTVDNWQAHNVCEANGYERAIEYAPYFWHSSHICYRDSDDETPDVIAIEHFSNQINAASVGD